MLNWNGIRRAAEETPASEGPRSSGWWSRLLRRADEAVESEGSEFRLNAADGAIAAGMLALTLAVCIPVAWSLHSETRKADEERSRVGVRIKQMSATLRQAENTRVASTLFRREVSRYVADVESRPIVSWATVITELSVNRPGGTWMARLSGSGPNFKASLRGRAESAAGYAHRLRLSPYVEFAAVPAADVSGTSQVVGRVMGE